MASVSRDAAISRPAIAAPVARMNDLLEWDMSACPFGTKLLPLAHECKQGSEPNRRRSTHVVAGWRWPGPGSYRASVGCTTVSGVARNVWTLAPSEGKQHKR